MAYFEKEYICTVEIKRYKTPMHNNRFYYGFYFYFLVDTKEQVAC